MMRALLALTALLLAVGCSNDGSQDFRRAAALFKSFGKSDAPKDPRDALTPELLAKQTKPLLSAELPARGQVALLRPAPGAQGADILWLTLDGSVTLSMRKGVLRATRGVRDDLMSSDLDQALGGIRGTSARALRVMRHLDGEDQLRLTSFVCDYSREKSAAKTLAASVPATRITEDCASPDRRIVNQYWIDARGVMRKSRQWVSPTVGYLLTERLVD